MMRIILTVFVCLALTAGACCFAAEAADNVPPQTGSYEFNNITLADALREISRDSGISINASFEQLRETIQKSYDNVPIDEIIMDLVKRQNNAIVWHYADQKIVAIDIRLEGDKTGRQDVKGGSPGVIRSTAGNHNRSRSDRGRVFRHDSPFGTASHPPAVRGERPVSAQKNEIRPSKIARPALIPGRDLYSVNSDVPVSPPKKYEGLEAPPMPPGM